MTAVDTRPRRQDHGAVGEVEVPQDLAERLEAVARRRGMSVSALLIEAVERKLAEADGLGREGAEQDSVLPAPARRDRP